MPQTFIEHLLRSRHCFLCWGYTNDCSYSSCTWGPCVLHSWTSVDFLILSSPCLPAVDLIWLWFANYSYTMLDLVVLFRISAFSIHIREHVNSFLMLNLSHFDNTVKWTVRFLLLCNGEVRNYLFFEGSKRLFQDIFQR